jgi:hypothetical protein
VRGRLAGLDADGADELARDYGFTDVDGSQQSPFWDRHWSA